LITLKDVLGLSALFAGLVLPRGGIRFRSSGEDLRHGEVSSLMAPLGFVTAASVQTTSTKSSTLNDPARKRYGCKLLKTLARPAGLEPATPGLEGRCSIQLSYGRG
jgi:hypothetical protein